MISSGVRIGGGRVSVGSELISLELDGTPEEAGGDFADGEVPRLFLMAEMFSSSCFKSLARRSDGV